MIISKQLWDREVATRIERQRNYGGNVDEVTKKRIIEYWYHNNQHWYHPHIWQKALLTTFQSQDAKIEGSVGTRQHLVCQRACITKYNVKRIRELEATTIHLHYIIIIIIIPFIPIIIITITIILIA